MAFAFFALYSASIIEEKAAEEDLLWHIS